MNEVAGIAGGVLGYITNGRRGAQFGYKLGKHFGKTYPKRMPAIRRVSKKRSAGRGFSRVRKVNPFKKVKTMTMLKVKPKHHHKKMVIRKREGTEIVHGSMINESMKISRVIGVPKMRDMDKGRWDYIQNYQYILHSTAGVQAYNNLASINTIQQHLLSTGVGYTHAQNYVALQQLNPYNKITGSTVIPASGGISTPPTDIYYLLSAQVTVELTNLSNIGVYMDLDVWRATKLGQYDVGTLWVNGLIDEANGVVNAVKPGPGTLLGTAGGAATFDIVGEKPHQRKVVKDFWKHVGSKEIYMTGDSTYKVEIHIDMKKKIKIEDLLQYTAAGAPNVYFPSTFQVTTIQRGAIVVDNTTIATPLATYGSTEVGCITTVKYVMAPVKGNAGRIREQYGVDRISAGAPLGNQKTVDQTDFATTANQA